jgi:DNA-binding NarL/FixJ family response regulator
LLDSANLASSDAPVTRFVLVDDHRLFCEGMRALVSHEAQLELVAVAHDAAEAQVVAASQDCDVVVVDVALPGVGGHALVRALKMAMPFRQVLMLSMHDEAEIVARCFDYGADGYALKSQSPEELFDAIRAVASGVRYLAPRLARSWAAGRRRGRSVDRPRSS